MPLRNTSGTMMVIGVVLLYFTALALIVDGFIMIITGVSNDTIIYVSAAILFSAVVAVALGILFYGAGHAIIWATYFMCVADRRRAEYALAKRAALKYVSISLNCLVACHIKVLNF